MLHKISPVLAALLLCSTGPVAPAEAGERLLSVRLNTPPEPRQFGYLGFEIRAEWLDGFFVSRAPETLNEGAETLFIDHYLEQMQPAAKLVDYPEWHVDEATGEAGYWARLANGVEFGATLIPEEERVRVEFRVRNETGAPLQGVHTQQCLTMRFASGFAERNRLAPLRIRRDGQWLSPRSLLPRELQDDERGWFFIATDQETVFRGGEPLDLEQGTSRALIARISADGSHLAAIAWDSPHVGVMSNTAIPCIHAGPVGGKDIPAGEEAVWLGAVYLMENDLGPLLELHEEDCLRWGIKPAASSQE